MSSVFQDPSDEDKLCEALKAFVAEWGAEHVIISVPKSWSEYFGTLDTLGGVKLNFVTENSISVRVDNDRVMWSYDAQLRIIA
jgi:hypothetical protein